MDKSVDEVSSRLSESEFNKQIELGMSILNKAVKDYDVYMPKKNVLVQWDSEGGGFFFWSEYHITVCAM